MLEKLTEKRHYNIDKNNPMYGKHPNHIGIKNPNYKDGQTLKIYYCKCGKKLSNYQAEECRICATKKQLKRNNHLLNFTHSGKNNGMFGIHRFGEDNPNWKGGYSFKPYPLGWNKTYKEQIRYRDGYKCQNCKTPEVELCRKLHVHHIDFDKNNINHKNLISLCHKCHAKTTVTKLEKKLYWISYYKLKIKVIYGA